MITHSVLFIKWCALQDIKKYNLTYKIWFILTSPRNVAILNSDACPISNIE